MFKSRALRPDSQACRSSSTNSIAPTGVRDLEAGETIYCPEIEGFGQSVKDFDIRVENLKTGAGTRITGDQPLSKLGLWAASTTLCPETYIDIKVEPGRVFKWDFIYEYYTIERR